MYFLFCNSTDKKCKERDNISKSNLVCFLRGSDLRDPKELNSQEGTDRQTDVTSGIDRVETHKYESEY